MLIEQAFFNLPEIMVGNGYAKQNYEAGIVSAFSLALLQEFNGRNINNPISNIYAERKYLDNKIQTYISNYKKKNISFKNLRCDLFVSLTNTELQNTRLYTYGFRENNYIEAKFFRGDSIKSNSTLNVYNILLDIYRLIILPSHTESRYKYKNNKSNIGRYFLHVYQGKPLDYIGTKFNWLAKSMIAGDHKLEIKLKENSSQFSNFPQLIMANIELTNFVIEQHDEDDELYTFILTRINGFNVYKSNCFHKICKNGDMKHNQYIDLLMYLLENIQNNNENLVQFVDNQVRNKIASFLNKALDDFLNDNGNLEKIKNIREEIRGKRVGSSKFSSEYESIATDLYSLIKSKIHSSRLKIMSIIAQYNTHLTQNEIKNIATSRIVNYISEYINNKTNTKDTNKQIVFKKDLYDAIFKLIK